MSRTVTTALASAAAGAALVLAFVVGTHNAVPAPDVVIPASSPAEVAPAVVVADDPTPEPTVEPKTEKKPAPVEVKSTAPRVVHEPAPAVSDDTAAQESADRAEAAARRAEKAADKAETETKPASPGPNPKPGSAGTTGVDPAGTSGTGNVTKTCVAPGVCSG